MKLILSINAGAQGKKEFSLLLISILEKVKEERNPFYVCKKTEKGFEYESVPGQDSYNFDLSYEGEIKVFINSYRGLLEKGTSFFRIEIPEGFLIQDLRGETLSFVFKKEGGKEEKFSGIVESVWEGA